MWYSALLSLATCLAIANAVIFTMPASTFASVTTGSKFVISWSNATGSVTILLKNGSASDFKTVETIATGLTGTSYTWTIPSTLPSATDYWLEIEDSSGDNYSVDFGITGGQISTASSTATVIKTSTTTSASSAQVPNLTSSTISFSAPPSASTITSSILSSSDSPTSPSITIVYQTTNTGSISISSATSTNTGSTSMSSSTSINENQNNTAALKSGLSAGAKAEIGVGVAFGVICLAGLGILLFVSGRRSGTRDVVSDPGGRVEKAELATDEAKRRDVRAELADGVPGTGYSNIQDKTELAEGTPRAELSG